MSRFCGVLLLICVGGGVIAQESGLRDQREIRSSKPSPDEQKARQAQKLFAAAVIEQRQDRLLDAIQSLEQCLQLDPAAIAPRKLLSHLYAAVGRTDDAIEQLQKITAAAPDDFDAWERAASLRKDKGESKAARDALRKAVETRSIQQNPERWLTLLNRLAVWSEKAKDMVAAEFALRELVRVLNEKQEPIRKAGVLTLAEIAQEKADALERLGEACLHNRKLDEAEQAFAESARLLASRKDAADAPRLARIEWQQAQTAEARGDAAKALAFLQSALRQRPSSPEPHRMLVRLLRQLDRSRDIIPQLEAFARADDKNVHLQLLLAEQYAENGRLLEVQKVFATLLESGPKPELYRALFKHYEKAHRHDMILKTLDERLAVVEDKNKTEEEREPANAHARAMYAVLRQKPALIRGLIPLAWNQQLQEFRKFNLNYRTYEVLGRLAARSGELQAAEALLRESLRNVPRRFDGGTCEALIGVLMAQKKYQAVIDLCTNHIADSDDNLFMFNYYQVVPHARLGNIKEALSINQTATELGADRNKFITRLQRVEILRWAGRYDEALKETDAILKEYSAKKEIRDAMRARAAVLSAKGEHGQAERELRKLFEQDPNDAGVCNDLGYQLAEQSRNLDESERLIRRAIELDRAEKSKGGSEDNEGDDIEENPAYLDSLAWVLFRKGQAADARRILEKAVAHPDTRDDITIWDHLGDVCYRLGDASEARSAWTRALENAKEERRMRKDSRSDEIQRKLQVLPKK